MTKKVLYKNKIGNKTYSIIGIKPMGKALTTTINDVIAARDQMPSIVVVNRERTVDEVVEATKDCSPCKNFTVVKRMECISDYIEEGIVPDVIIIDRITTFYCGRKAVESVAKSIEDEIEGYLSALDTPVEIICITQI